MDRDNGPYVALSLFIQALRKQPSIDAPKLAADLEALLTPPLDPQLEKFMRKMTAVLRTP